MDSTRETRESGPSAWLRKHHLITHVVITVLIVTPGYIRIENIVQSIIDARSGSRMVSCADSNEVASNFNTAISLVFQPEPGSAPSTPEEQARADRLLHILLLPTRDCTPAAIDKHYKERKP